jgi:hypothetical protein
MAEEVHPSWEEEQEEYGGQGMMENNRSLEEDPTHFPIFPYTPKLEEVTGSLTWAFWLHSYGFACLFFFLAFYSFFSILNLR